MRGRKRGVLFVALFVTILSLTFISAVLQHCPPESTYSFETYDCIGDCCMLQQGGYCFVFNPCGADCNSDCDLCMLENDCENSNNNCLWDSYPAIYGGKCENYDFERDFCSIDQDDDNYGLSSHSFTIVSSDGEDCNTLGIDCDSTYSQQGDPSLCERDSRCQFEVGSNSNCIPIFSLIASDYDCSALGYDQCATVGEGCSWDFAGDTQDCLGEYNCGNFWNNETKCDILPGCMFYEDTNCENSVYNSVSFCDFETTDCEDTENTVNPGISENNATFCSDGLDNDCDETIDCNDLDCSNYCSTTCQYASSCCDSGGYSKNGICYSDNICSLSCDAGNCVVDSSCCNGSGYSLDGVCYGNSNCNTPCPLTCEAGENCCNGEGSSAGGICYSDEYCTIVCNQEEVTAYWMNSAETDLIYSINFTAGESQSVVMVLQNSGLTLADNPVFEVLEADSTLGYGSGGGTTGYVVSPIQGDLKLGKIGQFVSNIFSRLTGKAVSSTPSGTTSPDIITETLVINDALLAPFNPEEDNQYELYFRVNDNESWTSTILYVTLVTASSCVSSTCCDGSGYSQDGNCYSDSSCQTICTTSPGEPDPYWANATTGSRITTAVHTTGGTTTVGLIITDSGLSVGNHDVTIMESDGIFLPDDAITTITGNVDSNGLMTASWGITDDDITATGSEPDEEYEFYFEVTVSSGTESVQVITSGNLVVTVIDSTEPDPYWANATTGSRITTAVHTTGETTIVGLRIANSGLGEGEYPVEIRETDLIGSTYINTVTGTVDANDLLTAPWTINDVNINDCGESYACEFYFEIGDITSGELVVTIIDTIPDEEMFTNTIGEWRNQQGIQKSYWPYEDGQQNTVVVYLTNISALEGTPIQIEIYEDNLIGRDQIRTISEEDAISTTVGNNGVAFALWDMTIEDIQDAGNGGTAENMWEFYFNVVATNTGEEREFSDEILNVENASGEVGDDCININSCGSLLDSTACSQWEECYPDPLLIQIFNDTGYDVCTLLDINCYCSWEETGCEEGSSYTAPNPGGGTIVLGNCVKTDTTPPEQNCDEGGTISISWTAEWVWDGGNLGYLTPGECEEAIGGDPGSCVESPENSGEWHYDPDKWSATCGPGSNTLACPAQIQLPFGNWINWVFAIIIILVIYYLISVSKVGKGKKVKKKKKK